MPSFHSHIGFTLTHLQFTYIFENSFERVIALLHVQKEHSVGRILILEDKDALFVVCWATWMSS